MGFATSRRSLTLAVPPAPRAPAPPDVRVAHSFPIPPRFVPTYYPLLPGSSRLPPHFPPLPHSADARQPLTQEQHMPTEPRLSDHQRAFLRAFHTNPAGPAPD